MDKMGLSTFDNFYRNKTVFVTGHTGFKGSWLCILLNLLGAKVYGYALLPPTNPSLYKEAKIDDIVVSNIGDIRDLDNLKNALSQAKPDIVIHMAAQALVLDSFKQPVNTYSTNIMGTINLLEAIRQTSGIRAVVNVTTDKCYENQDWIWGYRENDPVGGFDPYSNSKACSELVTACFRNSYFNPDDYSKHGVAVASARAGNVIGGGDWAPNRLIPDFVRAISLGEQLKIRSPFAIRPWQHVLEPLTGYLTLAAKLVTAGPEFAEGWNFGPEDKDAKNVEWITKTICEMWGNGASYSLDTNPQSHEASYLKLDCSKAKAKLNWQPRWDIEKALKSIVEWNKIWISKGDVREACQKQIDDYFEH